MSTKPSCYIAANEDRAIQPELQHFGTKRMGANVLGTESYVPMQSQAAPILDVCNYGAIVNAITATVMNAQACLNWLSAQPSDLEQIRRTLDIIAKDGRRAGEIIVRLRAPLERCPTADDALDS